MEKKNSFTVEIINYIKSHPEIKNNNNQKIAILYDLEKIMDINKQYIYEEYLVIKKFSKTLQIHSVFFLFDILSNVNDNIKDLSKENLCFYKNIDNVVIDKTIFIESIYKYLISKDYIVILQF
jgi:hypothetical protein